MTRPAATRGRVLALAAGAGLVAVWVASGSLVLALLVLVLVGGVAGLAALGLSALRPRPEHDGAPADLPTVAAGPTDGAAVRRVLRGALARPWVRGDGLVRATATRLRGDAALMVTARGTRAAAPHLWVEWNVADVVEVADRRPLGPLLDELAAAYAEHLRASGLPRPAAAPRLHLLARDDVPVGRVILTAAYAPPAAEAVAVAEAVPDAVAAAGARTPGPTPTAVRGPAPARWVLAPLEPGTAPIVLAGAEPGDDPVLRLGRDPRGDVVVDHPAVSWRHLLLRAAGGRAPTVEDLGSTNGTAVGGRRVLGPSQLWPGDVLDLGGGPRYRLVAPGDGRPPATATARIRRREAVRP